MLVHTEGRVVSDIQWLVLFCQHIILDYNDSCRQLPFPQKSVFFNETAWLEAKHSLVGADWNGLTPSLHFKVYLDWLWKRTWTISPPPWDCGLWFKSGIHKAALVHGFMQVVYSSAHELLYMVLSKEDPPQVVLLYLLCQNSDKQHLPMKVWAAHAT